ncbi:MAG: metal transporter [Candidatus Woesearchaeota archaeon]|nr:metal transporter [Candidatus Woesearchaeota archaeon]
MSRRANLWVRGLLPLLLLAVLLFSFVNFGPLGVFKASFPPIEEVFIDRVVFAPEQVTLDVLNDGPQPVTVSQVLVNDVYWNFKMEPSSTLSPLQRGKIDLVYPWVEGEPIGFTLIASDGVTFDKEVEIAFLTPTFNWLYFKTFVMLGLYVGVIPVLIGLLWFPFLKQLHRKWYSFLLAFTIGLLIFLGFDALKEAFDLVGSVAETLNGVGIFVIGFLLSILVLSAVSYRTEFVKQKSAHVKALVWGYLIALGIGLHNLGEGLAIGSAYAFGEIALGATLVIGFMVHNVTEGVAIVTPLTRSGERFRSILPHLVGMGILAGIPTILGTLIGGFSYGPALGVFFFAIGAGAIFDVAFDIARHLAEEKGKWISIFTLPNVIGFFIGLLVMYLTGFLVV